jgi:hypothetical protein
MASKSIAFTAKIEMKEFYDLFESGDRIARLSFVSAANREVMKARTQVVREVARQKHIRPQRLIARRMKITRANLGRFMVALRMLMTPVSAYKLQGVVDTGGQSKALTSRGNIGFGRTGDGVKTGSGYSWPKGFIARGRVGRGGPGLKHVFERHGRTRLKIRKQVILVSDVAPTIMQREMDNASQRVGDTLAKEIAWRLEKKALGTIPEPEQ